MPKLILSMDGLVLKEILLDKESITIGRKPHNDVQIDNLAISGEHAIVTTILNDAFLEDRNSTNGTYVNGQPIKKHVLQHNDIVELGKYRLKFIADKVASDQLMPSDLMKSDASGELTLQGGAQEQRAKASPEAVQAARAAAKNAQALERQEMKTELSDVETQILSPQARAAALASAMEPQTETRVGVLKILGGPNAGKELELTKAQTRLGKPGRQIVIIERRPQGYFLIHVEGETQPLINNAPAGERAQRLNAQDVVEVAGIRMTFLLRS